MGNRYYALTVLARLLGETDHGKGSITVRLRQAAKSQRLPVKHVNVVRGPQNFTYAADVSAITRYLRLPKEAEWLVERALLLALEELRFSHPRTLLTQEMIDKELDR